MAFNPAPRVYETTVTTGTGTYSLQGTSAGYQTFVAGVGDGNTTDYCVTNDTDWEEGRGTVDAAGTLSRDTIIASSNGGSAVNWGNGPKSVFCTLSPEQMRLIPWNPDTGTLSIIDASDNVLVEFGTDQIWYGTQAAYKSSAQLGDYHQSLVTKEYVHAQDTSGVPSGHLTHLDDDDPGGSALGVWGDGKFIYLANGFEGLHVYSVDEAGSLTPVDDDDQGSWAYGVWGDGKFLYLANGDIGLHVYSMDESGSLTHLDSHDPGGSVRGVWGDGRFIYLANYNGEFHVYSVGESGSLTPVASHDPGGRVYSVWGDGKFLYLANYEDGLHVYSVDESGTLTPVDFHDPGDKAMGVWGDGRYVYLANGAGGLHVYSVDESGSLTPVDSHDPGDLAYGVWGDGKFLYLANAGGGLHVYSVDESGSPTPVDSHDPGDSARSVWGDGRFIYIANAGGGLHVYSVDKAYEYDKANERHRFAGVLAVVERSAEPPDPPEGESYIWTSDGTEANASDGDLVRKVTAGGVTKIAVIQAFSGM